MVTATRSAPPDRAIPPGRLSTGAPRSFARRMWSGLRSDLDDFRMVFAPPDPPAAGLYTYRLTPPGGQIVLHLRIDPSGAGVLFIDVTDVIHLNPTAAFVASLALEGAPPARARATLRARHPDVDRERLAREVGQIYELLDRLRNPGTGCPTCSIASLGRAAAFSTPISAPFKADLALTYGCNNECPHCYNEVDRLPMPSLAAVDWFQVLDKLHAVGVPHIILTGGEATLHPDLPEIIRYANDLGLVVGLNTNGRRIAHEPYMRELAAAGLNHVQITLGSSVPAVHDAMMGVTSFEQTVRGIRSAIASGVHVITNTTLMRCNMGHAERIIDFLHDLGIRTFAMNGMIYSGGGFADGEAIPEAELAPLLIRVRDHALALGMRFLWYTPTEYCRMSPVELEIGAKRCNAGEYSLCIEPNGDVLPCQSYYTAAGNILRDPWETIWHSELFHSFRDREEDPRGSGLPEKCWECPDLPLCGGGCRIEREAREGRRTGDGGGGGCGSGGCGSGGGGGCGSGGGSGSGGGGGCGSGGGSGGGCSCGSGSHGSSTARSVNPTAGVLAPGGFVPNTGLTNTRRRAGGQMDLGGLIGLDDIGVFVRPEVSDVR
jgi:radical SAM protein with 4Fe4S-binding SPASM domain